MTVDLYELFKLDVPLLETFIRGTVVYLFLVLIMRFGKNRGMGSIGVSDMLVVIIVADASQNAMAGTYETITDGLLLVAVIIFWDYLIDFLCFKISWMEDFLQRQKVCLVKNGRVIRRNLRSEMITHEELMAQLRVNGIDDVKKVKEACLEANGEVSVIPYKK